MPGWLTRTSRIGLLLCLLVLVSRPARAGMVYLALGDSITFGNDATNPASTMRNHGDQGFVRPYADFLATQNGGVRPEVTNLAISGELASSFFNGPPPG